MSFQPESDLHQKRKGRNFATALCLVILMVVLVSLSLVKLRNSGPAEGFDHVRRPALETVAQ
ncbi:MAG: hypothetical protein AAF386_08055 [Pseudomonadota bacterium]